MLCAPGFVTPFSSHPVWCSCTAVFLKFKVEMVWHSRKCRVNLVTTTALPAQARPWPSRALPPQTPRSPSRFTAEYPTSAQIQLGSVGAVNAQPHTAFVFCLPLEMGGGSLNPGHFLAGSESSLWMVLGTLLFGVWSLVWAGDPLGSPPPARPPCTCPEGPPFLH